MNAPATEASLPRFTVRTYQGAWALFHTPPARRVEGGIRISIGTPIAISTGSIDNELVALQIIADICNAHWPEAPDEPVTYRTMGKEILLGDLHVADASDPEMAERIAEALQKDLTGA